MPRYYNYRWQTYYRPIMILRAGGRFTPAATADEEAPRGIYVGGARCLRCGKLEETVRKRSRIEVAHLDGDPTNNDWSNLACLCQSCHRLHDYKQWAARCKETRSIRKDQARPVLMVE
jgi:hypothetical protein